jgi:hypothetical protein
MKRILVLLLGLSLLALPNLVSAGCADVSRATGYYVQGGHDIIVYSRMTPLAYISLFQCSVNADSNIQFTKAYLCDTDSLIIDGDFCPILTIRTSRVPD